MPSIIADGEDADAEPEVDVDVETEVDPDAEAAGDVSSNNGEIAGGEAGGAPSLAPRSPCQPIVFSFPNGIIPSFSFGALRKPLTSFLLLSVKHAPATTLHSVHDELSRTVISKVLASPRQ